MSARIAGIVLWLLATVVASAQAQTVEYVHTDALGSVVAVTNASRTVLERREYEPYGSQLTPAVSNGPGYTGHVQDAATGLVYMQQRYYDAQIGRFLSVDPVTANSGTGDNFNRYWYALNNPYRYLDPDGREPGEAVHGFVLGLVLSKEDALKVQRANAAAGMHEAADAIGAGIAARETKQALDRGESVNVAVSAATKAMASMVDKKKGAADGNRDTARSESKRFSSEKEALVDMAKADKRTGITSGDMQAYKDLNKELPDPFPTNKVRGPESHDTGGAHSQQPHGHVGPVDHIPIKDPES